MSQYRWKHPVFLTLEMIDKMVNCTAVERQNSMGPVYVDYMKGFESIVFNEGADLSAVNFIKRRIWSFGAPIVARK
jgi:hypothetical protein